MAQLSLTDEEARTLSKALEMYVSDLRMEIGATDAHDFREGLKREDGSARGVVGSGGSGS